MPTKVGISCEKVKGQLTKNSQSLISHRTAAIRQGKSQDTKKHLKNKQRKFCNFVILRAQHKETYSWLLPIDH